MRWSRASASRAAKNHSPATHDDQETIDRFHLLWYEDRQRSTWRNTSWLGVPAQQCPCDLWVYQELINRVQPDAVVEVGVKRGGTTLYFAHVFDALYGNDLTRGRVVGVDIALKADPQVQEHRRISLIEGDSTAATTFDSVRASAGSNPIVLLDSNHERDHVLAELRLYSELIAPGGYLIVNDTNIAGHPALPWKEAGPFEAVELFLTEDGRFVVDEECEKHMLTQSPRGFLRRRA